MFLCCYLLPFFFLFLCFLIAWCCLLHPLLARSLPAVDLLLAISPSPVLLDEEKKSQPAIETLEEEQFHAHLQSAEVSSSILLRVKQNSVALHSVHSFPLPLSLFVIDFCLFSSLLCSHLLHLCFAGLWSEKGLWFIVATSHLRTSTSQLLNVPEVARTCSSCVPSSCSFWFRAIYTCLFLICFTWQALSNTRPFLPSQTLLWESRESCRSCLCGCEPSW